MADTIWGSTKKPVSSRKLSEIIEGIEGLEGTLYVGYPVLGTPSGAFPFDAVFLGPHHGVIVLDVVEGRSIGDFRARQDDLFTKLQSKLIQYPELVSRRKLDVPLTTVTFAPASNLDNVDDDDEDHPVVDEHGLADKLSAPSWNGGPKYRALAAAIQSLSNIRKGRKRREVSRDDSRGAKVRNLEESIANLDFDQGAAVIETVEGIQRIRGLAGSGKTIVLALKVAYLHAQHPDWKIAVTFNSRSLKGQFERLINTFVIEQTSEEPDWERVQIIHAWGAPGGGPRNGLYYTFCRLNEVDYYDYGSASRKFGKSDPFGEACQAALNSAKTPKEEYDAILVDEAQDFSAAFLRLCYALLKEPKRLVYAYDELQSLTDSSLPPPDELFGKNPDGTPVVTFAAPRTGEPKQDIILERCYRNSRPILATAHAMGFGIYRPNGLIQLFDQNTLWLDVGYRIHSGSLEDGKKVSLERTPETSPAFLETHSPVDDLILFKSFESAEEQDDWLVSQIEKNIHEDELFPEDIVVINPDPIKTQKAVAAARTKLFAKKINSSLAGVSTSADVFFANNLVTFTGIFRAKGNEAAMVYIINADDCFGSWSPYLLARARNQLFTAMTRSKAWVRVLGIGKQMDKLIEEYEGIKQHNFRLDFKYPTAEEKKTLKLISREVPDKRRGRGKTVKPEDVDSFLELLESGELDVEQLTPRQKERLQRALRSRK